MAMNHFGEPLRWPPPDTLRGTIERYVLGMVLFELLKSLEQRIVFSVRDLKIILDVIEFFMTPDLLPELLYFPEN
jgi:hypothetical protein